MSDWILPHKYNDIEAIKKTISEQASQIAALIMEPVINHEPVEGFLEGIRQLTSQNNIVLIFDEMKTGFRLDLGGAEKYFNLTADLAVFAKALSNGFPISVLAGKRALMEQLEKEDCFFSASYATEKASIKAALKTIEILQREEPIKHIWKMGEALKQGSRRILEKYNLTPFIDIVGFAPMTHFIFSTYQDITANEIKSFIQQECAKRKVLFVGYHHTSFAHKKEDIDYTLEAYDQVFSSLSRALKDKSLKAKISGKPISAFGVRR
ncbi:MAG: aminotransferase class III-fold pyridoxal phosphate-dependent enzyme, partial [Candidatus Omnitrophica bacterium]|nr:aminotransferase class III-fold pyridoxal phosphate-dependent enzyme [Candidatus Omnitrophota bacterium]